MLVKMLGMAFDSTGLAENDAVLKSSKSALSSISKLSPLNLRVRVGAAGVFQNSSSSMRGFAGAGFFCVTPGFSVRSRCVFLALASARRWGRIRLIG